MSQVTHDLTSGNGGTVELTESERHRLLESDRRRHTLAVLSERSQPVDLDDLADSVAAREAPSVTETDVATVATTLHHIHLPKMAAAGVIEYDPDSHQIMQ